MRALPRWSRDVDVHVERQSCPYDYERYQAGERIRACHKPTGLCYNYALHRNENLADAMTVCLEKLALEVGRRSVFA